MWRTQVAWTNNEQLSNLMRKEHKLNKKKTNKQNKRKQKKKKQKMDQQKKTKKNKQNMNERKKDERKKSRNREGGGALHERSGDEGSAHEWEQQMSRCSK